MYIYIYIYIYIYKLKNKLTGKSKENTAFYLLYYISSFF